MPYVCVVLGCSNRTNRETDKSFFRVPREVIKKGERTKDFTKRRRERWLLNLSLRSKGAESKNARVCSDHFVKGCPSSLYKDDDVDWAPTLNLGHDEVKEHKERAKSREEKRKHCEAAEALLEFHKLMRVETAEPRGVQEPDSAGRHVACQTDLTWDSVVCMEEELKRLNRELDELRSKALDTALSHEPFETSDDQAKFYTGLPNQTGRYISIDGQNRGYLLCSYKFV